MDAEAPAQAGAGPLAFAETKEFLRGIIEADPTPIFVKDRSGRYVFANQATADVFGLPAAEIVGKTDAELAADQSDVAAVRQVDLEVFNRFREIHSTHERLTDATGLVRWWETWKRPLIASDGTCSFLLGVAVDRTRQVEIELELRHNRDELEDRVQQRTSELSTLTKRLEHEIAERSRAEALARRRLEELTHLGRVAVVNQVAAQLAHQVNQPLAAISNYVQGCLLRLQAGTIAPGELVRVLEIVRQQSDHAAAIIRRMREFAKKRDFHQADVQVRQVIEEAVELVAYESEQLGIEIGVECDDRLAIVHGDFVQLEQAILNLIRNAIDALRETERDGRWIRIDAQPARGDFVCLRVRDNGPGLSPALAETAFEPFVTSKQTGLGLGLPICREIVSAHGGTIVLRSSDDGCIAEICLPMVKTETRE
ncbi:MAG: PAS domain-containing protein [Planctomycetes bacterium]|nr:PAS domain-containing protein [Planctomycetota bacterium]